MSKCLICKKGEIIRRDSSIKWYECTHCGVNSDKLSDGVLYPLWRRGTLCSQYTPVIDLKVDKFQKGEIITFLTIRKTKKKAAVLHVDVKHNQMMIEDVDTKKVRIVVDNEEIADAYDALFPENKIRFAGWWNRRIEWK